ncbi:hypothetical protein HYX16_02810 [Candidatus Woesearchaeota archaeon]|nr:hypothetical protein [Candidatus Woesearchaeota archaeon]
MNLPDRLFGKSTSESYERVMKEKYSDKPPKADKPRKHESKKEKTTSVQGVNLSDYVFVQQHELYVAKERTLQGNNWHDAHKEAHKQNARMLTLREFVDFLLLLKSGNAEDGLGNKISKSDLQNIYLDITEVRDPYRAEWLDAKFVEENRILHINYNHRTKGRKLGPTSSEPLETCIMKNCKVELSSFNKQGIPTKEGNDFNYWYPINGTVAGFYADAGRAGLGCYGGPLDSVAGLGVRLAREK